MINLTIKRNKIQLSGDVSTIDSSILSGYTANNLLNTANIDLDIHAVDNLCKQIQCRADDKVKTWYVTEKEKRNNALQVLNNSWNLDMTGLNTELKEYQKQAIAFFEKTKNCLIGYDMGLGKSLIAINCIKLLMQKQDIKRVLIVCPSYLKYSWEDEVSKWSTISTQVIDGNPSKRDEQFKEFQNKNKHILIINYEQIRLKIDKKTKKVSSANVHSCIQKKWDIIIWDEAQRLKSRDSGNSAGAYALQSDYKIMLSGTPVTKSPAEFWRLLNILDRNRFKSYWSFCRYYCQIVEGFRGIEVGNLTKPKEYQELLQTYMIRKLKQDVAKLPEKFFFEINVRLSEEQKKVYEKARLEYLKPSDDIIESDVERFIRLNQIVQCPAILDGGKDISITRDTAIDILQDIPNQVIVACTFINMSDILFDSIKKKFKKRKVYLINSKIPVKSRYDIIEEFKQDESGILITTIRCLAEGYNLDCCDNIIMTDIDWNCGVNKQFQNRIHRLTSTRSKNYYMIIVMNTVNDYKYKKIMTEKLNAEIALNDSKENIILKISNDYRKEVQNEI